MTQPGALHCVVRRVVCQTNLILNKQRRFQTGRT
jgi:hypothetical protein